MNRITRLASSACRLSLSPARTAALSSRSVFSLSDQATAWYVSASREVPELGIIAHKLRHATSNCRLVYLQSEDQVGASSINFRTIPASSNGVCHILEHTVLCGSEKFPVRDPFFKMLNRSMSTFMNAMTGPDYTMYPFSTPNATDFRNLFSVYADAVFRPKLNEFDFRQEGWRLELGDNDSLMSDVTIKGVVYNEMKGVYADAQQMFSRSLLSSMLPTHVYSVCSGGIPANIPDLTWSQLRTFHATYYSPENATVFVYGNRHCLDSAIAVLEQYLEAKKQHQPNSSASTNLTVRREADWHEPRYVTLKCAPQPGQDAQRPATLAVAYRTCPSTDLDTTFALSILSRLLFDDANSPFYDKLIASGLVSTLAPCTGFEADTSDTLLTVGLQGVDPAAQQELINHVDAVFANEAGVLEETMLNMSRIESVLHSLELGLRRRSVNFGLHLILGNAATINQLIHSKISVKNAKCVDDEDAALLHRLFDVQGRLNRFKSACGNRPDIYLRQLIDRYFAKNANNNKLTLLMTPDETYNTEQKVELDGVRDVKWRQYVTERASGDEITARRMLQKEGQALEVEQKRQEDRILIERLPTLTLEDVKAKLDLPGSIRIAKVNRARVQINIQPTNDVVYLRAKIPLCIPSACPSFSDVQWFTLAQAISSVTSVGAGDRDYKTLATVVDSTCGGLDVSISWSGSRKADTATSLILSTHCLRRNISATVDLWRTVVTDNHLMKPRDSDEVRHRIRTLLQMAAADVTSSLTRSGHSYAMSNAAARSGSAFARQRDACSGISAVRQLVQLQAAVSSSSVVTELHTAMAKEFSIAFCYSDDASFAVNCGDHIVEEALVQTGRMNAVLDSIPKAAAPAASSIAGRESEIREKTAVGAPSKVYLEFAAIPSSVHFCARAIPTGVKFGDPGSAALRVTAALLSASYLHPMVRERGGAYGSGASYDAVGSDCGMWQFFSYRDPNTTDTVDVFDRAVPWLMQLADSNDTSHSDRLLAEAKMRVFKAMDAPSSVGDRGLRFFMHGIKTEAYDAERTAVREVTYDDVIAVARRHLTATSDDKAATITTILGGVVDRESRRRNFANDWHFEVLMDEQ